MNKFMKKMLVLAIVICLVVSFAVLAVGCKDKQQNDGYTYTSYSTALATNWNPHTWETNADQDIYYYLTTPLVDMSIKNSTTGEYQWVYEMATDVKDVTADHRDDLSKFGTDVKDATKVSEGYVYEISLNQNAKWENGVKITADDYIYSMQQLLNPDMKNYRANLYLSGESALAGAYEYYYSKDKTLYKTVQEAGYASNDEAIAKGETVYLDMWNFWGLYGAVDANGNECPQYVSITDTTKYRDMAVEDGEPGDWISASDIYNDESFNEKFQVGGGYAAYLCIKFDNENMGYPYEKVGCYKVDDYTIRYVCKSYLDINNFLVSLTSNWLVYKDLYEGLKDTSGSIVTTTYCTSKETTMSYGVYKLDSFQEGKQMVMTQNPNWYGFTTDEDGKLISYTNFDVDGGKVQQYQTTKIVINVMDDASAKQAFFKGEISEYTPSAEEFNTYKFSDQFYSYDETYTLSLFFNTNEDMLKEMDKSKGNTNSIVLSNINFRNAFSLAVNRTEFVTATPGYKPSYSLMSDVYYYDIFNDINSVYRKTDVAMQAIVNMYGIEYGEGTAYPDLKTAYESITGYNLTEAKALMKKACEELVAAGLYTAGQEIKIQMAWAAGAISSDDNKQITLINNYINAAAEGSGFGKITLTGVGNLSNRYIVVPNGEYAIGYGAWGGAALYPFRNFQVYMDPSQYDINEAANYDPTTETLTLNIQGEDVTMTWQAWSNCMIGSGKYAAASNEVKLEITAKLEEAFLSTYYRIPLCTTVSSSLLSYQVSNYTDNYSEMYGFGGLRLMKYNYNDQQWADFVKSEGGTLSYV